MVRSVVIGLMLAILAPAAHALDLHWSSGGRDLQFSTATRCTLVVETSAGEVSLPGEWRLAWSASNCGALTLVPDTVYTDTLTAQVAVAGFQSASDEAAGVRRVEFQGKVNGFVTSARYIVDLPAGGSGKFQAHAVKVSDEHPNGILLQSPVATFNGGSPMPLPPTILTASGMTATEGMSMALVGTGLASTASVELVAPDASWSIPLEVSSATDTSLTVAGGMPAELSESVLKLTNSSGSSSTMAIAGAACRQYPGIEFQKFNAAVYVDPNPGADTKDFAFFYNHGETTPGLFHLMYIRSMQVPLPAESTLAHAWSTDSSVTFVL